MNVIDAVDQSLIKMLQGTLPLTENPYQTMGEKLGLTEDEVVQRLQALHDAGKLKRIAAILRHQQSGYRANAMVVLQVPEDLLEKLGRLLAESPLVSHSYERKTYERWPYNLYAMMHGKTAEEIEAFVGAFVAENGVEHYEILYSEEELKKTSMVYFE